MKHGDISNQSSFIIGVRCDDTLFKSKGNPLLNVVDKILKNGVSQEVDGSVLRLVQYIYRRTDYTVILICDKRELSDSTIEKLKELFPFEVRYVEGIPEISRDLMTGDLSYYVDDNDYRRGLVNSEYAVDTNKFNTILRRKGRAI